MQARALVRGISMSPRKMRVVANLVRNKKVEDAVGLLDLMPKRAAGIISKAIKSAAANAEERSGGDASIRAPDPSGRMLRRTSASKAASARSGSTRLAHHRNSLPCTLRPWTSVIRPAGYWRLCLS